MERVLLEWSIRSANPADLPWLAALVEVGTRDLATRWPRGALEPALSGKGARIRVALGSTSAPGAADDPAATGLGFVIARRIADLLEIDLVGVHPDARRRGVARALLTDLLEREAASGATEARLELAASNAPACALYESVGFVVVGRRTRYYPDGDDALLLSRAIAAGRSLPSP
jgi:ribosomal-protein-alanine N-acetyltransferase